VITRHVLPRVLAFKDFIAQQRLELSQPDWEQKFGAASTVLNQHVLPKFSNEAIAEAQRMVDNETLYIPISLKV
jgi:hypothetical protein